MPRREIPRPSITHLFELAGGRVYSNGKALCPLHEDHTPSAQVFEDDGRFACYVCDIHGDQIDFIKEWKRVDFSAAVNIAADVLADSGGELPRDDRQSGGLLPNRKGHRQGRRNWQPPWICG